MQLKHKKIGLIGRLGRIVVHAIRKDFFLFAVLAGVLVLYFIYKSNLGNSDINTPDKAVAYITFIVAIFIGLDNARNNWINSLPKVLNTQFIFSNQIVMDCRYASLAGEADIRQWAQQIGLQMNGGDLLDFYPNLQIERPIVVKLDDKVVNLYSTKVNLISLPKNVAKISNLDRINWVMSHDLDNIQTLVYYNDGKVEEWSEVVARINPQIEKA